MMTKRTFAMSFLLTSVIMIAFSGPTQVQAQLFGSDQIPPGDTVHLVELVDASASISQIDPDGGGCNPPADLCSEWDFERFGLANALDAFILTQAGQKLLGFLFISVIQFGTAASLQCSGQIDTEADMTTLTDCIKNPAFVKDDDLTDIEEAIQLADTQFAAEPSDHNIIDIISDGNPTDCAILDCTNDEAEAAALDARDVSAGLGLERLVAVAVALPDAAYLSTLVHPGAPGNIIPPDNFPVDPNADDGFVVIADTFSEVESAILAKLVVTTAICPLGTFLPPGGTIIPDDCIPIPVGGEFLSIDSTALLIAGLSVNMSLLAPIVLAIAGAGYYIVRTRMNKD